MRHARTVRHRHRHRRRQDRRCDGAVAVAWQRRRCARGHEAGRRGIRTGSGVNADVAGARSCRRTSTRRFAIAIRSPSQTRSRRIWPREASGDDDRPGRHRSGRGARLATQGGRVDRRGRGRRPRAARCAHDMLDVAAMLGLPVLLVVGLRLGCLNHALLSALAIRRRGLELRGWVANRLPPAMPSRGPQRRSACRAPWRAAVAIVVTIAAFDAGALALLGSDDVERGCSGSWGEGACDRANICDFSRARRRRRAFFPRAIRRARARVAISVTS